MTTYVIGDVQGCFASLERLLSLIQFHPEKDVLWFTGDLVNRGRDSLGVLRLVRSLGDKHIVVLGNHDLHLLAVARGFSNMDPKDTLGPILRAPDCDELLTWLIKKPLLHYDAKWQMVLTHAGLAPCWSLDQAMKLAHEVEAVLESDDANAFLSALYGNQPDLWDDGLTGVDRIRCIVNYFTRMRFCDSSSRLDFAYKGELTDCPPELYPWFLAPNRRENMLNIVFGHWAALNGNVPVPHVFALDTGCVWGNRLTAMQLDNKERFSVPFIADK